MLEGYQNKQIKDSPKKKGIPKKKKGAVHMKAKSKKVKKNGKVRKFNFPQLNTTVEASTLQEALSIINNQ